MNALCCIALAALSIWDYPSRQPMHEKLRGQFIAALRTGDTETMTEVCRKGVELLPDDPTWRYNLACSLSYFKDQGPALDALEKAIDLGFRDPAAIAADSDLKRLEKNPRFRDLVEYADEMKRRPLLLGPMAVTPATGAFGETVTLGGHNLAWNFDVGCFDAKLSLVANSAGGNTGDLYFNRDEGQSMLVVTNWPGLTQVKLDREGRERGMDLNWPNMLFPYPVFGNCSRAMLGGQYWRSLPRALMTTDVRSIGAMHRFYRTNQIWVFPAVYDCQPLGTNGDVFASVTPYWIATEGRSWSDQYYLRAALEASRSFRRDTKRELVRRGLLAPTVQMLVRRSLRGVAGDADYLGPKAHPTAFPANGLDLPRLAKSAAEMTVSQIPPVAVLAGVGTKPTSNKSVWPELTYATPCACAFVLRAEDRERTFDIKAAGGEEFEFAVVHDDLGAAKLERRGRDAARVTVDRAALSPTNRVDLAVFAKNVGTGWGAPSFVSLAVVDPSAPYSDPALTPLDQPKAE
ncbi:MAG: hypothetical protein IJI73_06690 [Kiritimatiellae bacterium]|nr:hypothetical protein [Kiritimatiellia bacterium]